MTRKFWGGMMFASIIITVGAGYFVFSELTERPMPKTPQRAPKNVVAPISPTSNNDTPAGLPTNPARATEVSTQTTQASLGESAKTDTPKPGTRKILLNLPKPAAEQVSVIGDFNDWKPEPLSKNGKTWQTTVELEPGTYKYLFVVDGKKIRDPNNKNSSEGKSLLNVKSLAPKN